MANVMHTHKGKIEGEDTRTGDLFASMSQGRMSKSDGRKGLFQTMHQGSMKGSPGRPRPGKTAPSVARAMGQGGK